MPEPAALDARGVQKSYALGETKLEVLRGIELTVQPGQMCAIMGPSGVGKSTLLNCAAGLDVADSGVIEVLGADVGKMSDHDRTLYRRRNIGIVYQFFNLVSNLSAFENVALPYLIEGQEPDRGAIDEVIERVGMSGRRDHFPSQLSGGEMQLISIARAIVTKPGIVLADEPTGNVNVATGKRIMKLLKSLAKESGSALVIVTHNPDDAAKADRVVFMKDGLLADGSELNGDEVSPRTIHERLEALEI